MSKVSRQDIEKVARLSRLAFSPEESERFAAQLNSILEYADKINALPTDDIEPTAHGLTLANVFRPDEPRPGLTPDEALANAPETEAQCFKVPPIIQEMG